jgi:hypothetical protein
MALRRVIKTQSQDSGFVRYTLGPAKAYLDDVQSIAEALLAAAQKRAKDSEANEPVQVLIAAGEAIADEPSDLRDARPEELQRARIAIKDPLISVDLWKRGASVSTVSSDVEGQELAVGIKEFVNRRRSPRAAIFLTGGVYSILTLVSGVAIAIGLLVQAHKLWPLSAGLAIFAFGLIFGSNGFFAYRYGSVHLIPRRESEMRGLSSEMRKQLIIALISAIVGGVIVGLASLWAGVYVHH